MSLVVVDSGFIFACFLRETYTEQAKAVMNRWQTQHMELAAPTLIKYELTAAARKAAFQGRITNEESEQLLTLLLSQPVQVYLDDALLRRAFEIAHQFNFPRTYDTQYLALAERLGCEVWTADERLYNVARDSFAWVKWIGQTTP